MCAEMEIWTSGTRIAADGREERERNHKGLMTCGGCPDMEKCQTVGMIISNNPEALKNLIG